MRNEEEKSFFLKKSRYITLFVSLFLEKKKQKGIEKSKIHLLLPPLPPLPSSGRRLLGSSQIVGLTDSVLIRPPHRLHIVRPLGCLTKSSEHDDATLPPTSSILPVFPASPQMSSNVELRSHQRIIHEVQNDRCLFFSKTNANHLRDDQWIFDSEACTMFIMLSITQSPVRVKTHACEVS